MGKNRESTNLEIKPLSGYVLVQPEEPEQMTASGIVLPDTAKERPAQGRVLAVGDDLVLESGKILKCPVKVGDRVIYKKWGGDEIKIKGVEYKLVRFDDLMAILL